MIGMTVVTAAGDLVKSGGRVVKNVAGYDLAKLHIGGLGTLGVITQVSLKVAPLPPDTVALTTEAASPEKAFEAAREIGRRRLNINGLVAIGVKGQCSLAIRAAGSAAAVARSRSECEAIAAGLRLDVVRKEPDVFRSLANVDPNSLTPVVIKIAAPNDMLADIGSRLMELGARLLAYPTAGVVYGRFESPPDELATEIGGLRVRLGATGAVVVEAAPPAFKQQVDVWGPPRGDFALMRRLKDEMDPNHILNSGRFIGGI